jgi:DnaK suppressor protein
MKQFPKDILQSIKNHLEDEKNRLKERIAELSVQDPFTDTDRTTGNAATDMEASEESDHDRVSALVEALKREQDQTQEALIRIEAGTYGFCTICGDMIDTDRLAILPTAILCLKHEKEKAS